LAEDLSLRTGRQKARPEGGIEKKNQKKRAKGGTVKRNGGRVARIIQEGSPGQGALLQKVVRSRKTQRDCQHVGAKGGVKKNKKA